MLIGGGWVGITITLEYGQKKSTMLKMVGSRKMLDRIGAFEKKIDGGGSVYFFPRDIFLPVTSALFENCHGHFFVSRALFGIFLKKFHGQKKNVTGTFFQKCHGQLFGVSRALLPIFQKCHGQLFGVSRALLPIFQKCHGHFVNVTGNIFIPNTHTHTHTHPRGFFWIHIYEEKKVSPKGCF